MKIIEKLGLMALHRFDPEVAHGLALRALNTPFAPLPGPVMSSRLETEVAGVWMPNPIGLAAGFDKNATAVAPLMKAGFGFLEIGAATPRPQTGNAKPRLFRLSEDRAAINRFGFNNDGMKAITDRLSERPEGISVGLNLGANKDSPDKAADFAQVLAHSGWHLDFATVNVSSPNTEKLRDLQGVEALWGVLTRVILARDTLQKHVPVFLKIAPDLTRREITEIAEVAIEARIDAIIATNTTVVRDGLRSLHRRETGGLSGAPLFEKSTHVMAALCHDLKGKIPVIGVGGIANAEQAYAKIQAGASAVQLYTAMVYHGISLGAQIARDLDKLLARDGFANIADAVGTRINDWI